MSILASPPGTHEEVSARYRDLHTSHQARADTLGVRRKTVLQLLAADVLGVALLTGKAFNSRGSAAPLLLAFLFAAVLLWLSLHLHAKMARQQRLLALYLRCEARSSGLNPQSGRTGIEAGDNLRSEGHLYDRDLDLLGENSLFGLLATVRTGPGERGLARYLLEPATRDETLRRQDAVKELLPQTELREEISLLGASTFHQISAKFFDEWLADRSPAFHPFFRILLVVTATLAVALLLVGFTHVRPWGTVLPNLAADLAVQGAISLALRRRVLPLLQGGARLQANVQLFSAGLALLQKSQFRSPKLQALRELSLSPTGAVKLLAQLDGQLAIVEQRPKEYFLLFSLLLAAGTQAAISIAAWKRQHASAMKQWLEAWSEFEALNALATYAFEHPEDTWPELLPPEHLPTFEARGLAHPLLLHSIRNDVSLSSQTRFYLVSGSNMAGKSTLLRSIGINAVLAYAGAPVRAESLRISPLILGASLALTDSLAEGKSKFLAEVQRLSAIVTASKTNPVLFLVDEIFSGTNSADRRTAAEAVLTTLLSNNAIGALSTHDLALTELATEPNRGLNLHMASSDPEDPLAFDYKLKPGINTSSNALAIVRMMGLKIEQISSTT